MFESATSFTKLQWDIDVTVQLQNKLCKNKLTLDKLTQKIATEKQKHNEIRVFAVTESLFNASHNYQINPEGGQ